MRSRIVVLGLTSVLLASAAQAEKIFLTCNIERTYYAAVPGVAAARTEETSWSESFILDIAARKVHDVDDEQTVDLDISEGAYSWSLERWVYLLDRVTGQLKKTFSGEFARGTSTGSCDRASQKF